jgi:RNA polymerase-binding transcription factor DksA
MTPMPDLDDARTRLLEERAQLQRQLDEIEHDRVGDGPIDMLGGDAGADTTAATAELNLRAQLVHSLAEIDAALRRIELGTYGIDEETGEPIDPARLEAIPTARTNIR